MEKQLTLHIDYFGLDADHGGELAGIKDLRREPD
jgi:hypothetical protein